MSPGLSIPPTAAGVPVITHPSTADVVATASGQTIHADTGWRSLAEFNSSGTYTYGSIAGTQLAPRSGQAGGVRIRRLGNRVTARIVNVAVTATGSWTAEAGTFSVLPAGFKPAATSNHVAAFFGATAQRVVALRVSLGDNALEVDYPQTLAENGFFLTEISWTCDEAWPSTLPGALYSAAPA